MTSTTPTPSTPDPAAPLRVGDWRVDPATGEIANGDTALRLDQRALQLLTYMAARPGTVVSVNDLLDHVWQGVVVTPDSVYQAIAGLRRTLGDDAKSPSYIVTVPRRGYQLIAPVGPWERAPQAAPAPATPPPRRPARRRLAALCAGVLLAAAGAWAWMPSGDSRAVAVLPFHDLTDSMTEEPFADGMTEELIDRLSREPGMSVTPPTASSYYKDKRVTVADVANALRVAYVLDGSVRRSGDTLRVAARLTRARDGFVVWSRTYDRAWHDKLMIQDDIAAQVAHATASTVR